MWDCEWRCLCFRIKANKDFLFIAVIAWWRAEVARGRTYHRMCRGEGFQCRISQFLTFTFSAPGNPVMYVSPIYRLQQNRDWLLCACPIRWEFLKREVSLSLQDIYSVPLLSSVLRLANRMRSCRQIDGQQRAGGDGMKLTKEFLADHYLTHTGRAEGKAISTATNSYFSPAACVFLSQQISFYLQLIQRYPKELEDTGKRLPKIYSRRSNQILLAHYEPYATNNCMLYCILFIPPSPIPTLQLI